LRSSRDVNEALERAKDELRVLPENMHLREKAVEAAVQAGLDAETDDERIDIGKWLVGLIHPAHVVTLDMLARAVGAFLAVYDDLVTDVPRAGIYFADMLGPLADVQVLPSLDELPSSIAKELSKRPAVANRIARAKESNSSTGETTKKNEIVETITNATPTIIDTAADADGEFIVANTKKKKKAPVAFE
jgi:hypothetical protein